MIVEAWGADLASCIEAAVDGLVSIFLDTRRAKVVDHSAVHLPRAPSDALLLHVLEAAIFAVDTESLVPIRARTVATDDGGLDVTFRLADRRSVTLTGSVPKGISRSELCVEHVAGEVRCRFLVDV